ncbi:bacillithiol biosynthesis cysteine-adding enzyme BshC [Bacteroidota bacterium]
MYINFSDIPGQNELFLDYLYNFENVARFYKNDFRDFGNYGYIFERVSTERLSKREEVTSIIRNQYKRFSPSKKTQYNIDLLKSENTLAVVTGQQLGIFGGPLYTFYKIITTIKLCKYLKENHDKYQFVPVFWMEGDDHDLDEIRSCNLINNKNEIETISYDDGLPPEENRGSVGNISLDDNIEGLLAKLESTLRDTEYKDDVMNLLSSHYKKGSTFKEAFSSLLFELFDDEGLVIFDPVDVEVKKLLSPIFSKEIEDFREHTAGVVERSAELEETYHTQVKIKPINLFMLDGTERLLIEPVEDEFRLKGKRKKFSLDEILEVLQNEPERFSPNVLLRPICQDYLLPTAVYVGGPGEISYFAQVIPLYQYFKIVQPIIYPRSSLTIVEKNIKDITAKYKLDYKDMFTDTQNLEDSVISSLSDVNLEKLFNKYLDHLNEPISGLREQLKKIDGTLEDPLNKTINKIEQSLNQLKSRAQGAEKRKFEAAIRQITKTKTMIYPNDNLQERELNFIYFINKYGLDILNWIFSELTINKFEHQFLNL